MAKTRKLSPALKAWNVHWKKVRAEMEKKGTFKKGDNLTKVFKEAKKSFKSHKKGGGDDPEKPVVEVDPVAAKGDNPEAPVDGGSRRRKTKRRASKH
jgi:hypothetical protein